ncbi:hypothetical protein IGI04_009962 [Brassica rapa subsp. trilocularis]|uniref:Amino acid transporter transmembrane domain-containing protein n=1 Tax=Brassica rapa subsp. trilocularis TaxID=1813537 RepID=A0ABQ7MZS7_BRACM|nr:hypothetical protein IGI04_009962 [Brassica rapa subsp. trilocularis]
MFPMLTVPVPPRFRPPPDPPPCKSLPLGFLSPLKPSEPPEPPDITCLWSITAKYVAVARLPPPETPLLSYPSLCGNFHPTIDFLTIVELILYSAIECSLPIITFYSAIECLLPITSWFQICLTSSRMEYSMLNCRFIAWLWFQILFINTLLKPTSTFLLPWFLYRCCSCVARSTFGLEDCSTDDLFSVLFKGSAFWCYTASAIVASVKIVIPALIAEPITSIRSLIVFFVSHGFIPLLKPSVGEIRGRLCNVSCLCIMIASIFVFLLAFCCTKVVSQYGFVIIFVNNFSFNGD